MNDTAKPQPLSDAELAEERDFAFNKPYTHGVFGFSTVQSIELRFIATIDADRAELRRLKAVLARYGIDTEAGRVLLPNGRHLCDDIRAPLAAAEEETK